jgi:hypothetical protein
MEIAAAETSALQGGPPSPPAHCDEGQSLLPAATVPTPALLSHDVEVNLSLAVTHFLAALKMFDTQQVRH